MKEMMKRYFPLGFSLSFIALSGIRNKKLPALESRPGTLPLAPPPTTLPQPELHPLMSISGTVIRDGSRFALRDTTGALFALSSTGRAWPFEGEDVQVTGRLDAGGAMLQIQAIHAVEDLHAEAV